jgi:hypothetical protein
MSKEQIRAAVGGLSSAAIADIVPLLHLAQDQILALKYQREAAEETINKALYRAIIETGYNHPIEASMRTQILKCLDGAGNYQRSAGGTLKKLLDALETESAPPDDR